MPPKPYTLRISRLTVDKLGVKLYDKASAVVSELIANGYDADAELVTVSLPLGTLLADSATKQDNGFQIVVDDNGHGMTPDEAQEQFLRVGRDRREIPSGEVSRKKKRPVMGRKGIGKLAPFGICQMIEVRSAGGVRTPRGYQVTHFFMDYGKIVTDNDQPVTLKRGPDDRTYSNKSGTRITLSMFQPKRVPSLEVFLRQLAARFILGNPQFKISVIDTRNGNQLSEVAPVHVPIHEETKIDLSAHPIVTSDGTKLKATGWLAMGSQSYQNEEFAGVRIYARNKIVATTRDFEQPAGFTGEFTMRSYLVGEVHAEWLDLDVGEDLIRSDRQGILWDSDYGRELKDWGAKLIKEIARRSSGPRRESAKEEFLKNSDFVAKAKRKYPQPQIQKAAIELATKFGSFAAKDELKDKDYLDGLADVILSVAPHKALIEAFQRFSEQMDTGSAEISDVVELFSTARIAELASYSQIADQRVRSIRELRRIVHEDDNASDESDLQNLIAKAPWLIHPTWTVLTKNQSISTFAKAFQKFYKQKTGEDLEIEVGDGVSKKRPDFTAVDIGQKLYIVEVKSTGHKFDDADWGRLANYLVWFDEFFDTHRSFKEEFPNGHQVILVADEVKIRSASDQLLYKKSTKDGTIVKRTWNDFLVHAEKAHSELLKVSESAASLLQ